MKVQTIAGLIPLLPAVGLPAGALGRPAGSASAWPASARRWTESGGSMVGRVREVGDERDGARSR